MANVMELKLETTDGTNYEVSVIFADMIRYDIVRNREKMPAREGNEFLFMGLIAFCALLRTGQIPAGTKTADFLNTIASIEPVDAVEADEEAAEFQAE